MTITYPLQGLTCQKCVSRVTAALAPLAQDVRVTLDPPAAMLTGATADKAAIRAALQQAGHYDLAEEGTPATKSWLATYRPLLLIIGYISLGSLAAGSVTGWMHHFMTGFFLVFSFFKFLDLRGFADAYASYDLLAARWRPYGFIYPFIELGLGIAYLFHWQETATNWFVLFLMLFGSIGVIQTLRAGRKIRCACLGTVLNLPMSTVTIVEDLGMAAMAAAMLFMA